MKTLEFLMLMFVVVLVFSVGFVDAQSTNSTLPDINATNAVVVPASPAITYNKYWLSSLQIYSPAPNHPANLRAVLVPYDGAANVLQGHSVMINIPDVFTTAKTDATVAQAMGAALTAIESVCKSQGKCQ